MARDGAELGLIIEGTLAADDLLARCFRVPLEKAFDLRDARGFDRAVARLGALLRARSAEPEEAAVRAALEALDVDWARTTARQRRTLMARAMEVAGRRASGVVPAVRAVFGGAARDVVGATRDAARRGQALAIASDFNAIDRRVIRYLETSELGFVRDEYGRRHQALTREAHRVVADGLAAGLGREDIARDLEHAARSILVERSPFYWEVVAGAFIARGRSFAQLSAYAEASIDRYTIAAVLDERTTEICRFLDGKSFSVSRGLATFERAEASPDSLEKITPWVREAVSEESGRKALYVERGGRRIAIAEVTRSAAGTRDDRGEFARGRTERELADLGVSFPPYHGLCRTTTVADIS